MSEPTLQKLQEQVDALTRLCQKQSKLIAATGTQLLELRKLQVANADPKKHPDLSAIDFDDFATNDDLVLLVAELQGQLEQLEDRQIRRTLNARSAAKDDVIAPLVNQDGELPDKLLFPATVGQLETIEKYALVLLAEFYDLMVVEESWLFDKRVDSVSDDMEDELFNRLARFLGLSLRRGDAEW